MVYWLFYAVSLHWFQIRLRPKYQNSYISQYGNIGSLAMYSSNVPKRSSFFYRSPFCPCVNVAVLLIFYVFRYAIWFEVRRLVVG